MSDKQDQREQVPVADSVPQNAADATRQREATEKALEELKQGAVGVPPEVQVAKIEAATTLLTHERERETSLKKIEAEQKIAAEKEKTALAAEMIKADTAKVVEQIRSSAAARTEGVKGEYVVKAEGVKGKYVVVAAVATGLFGGIIGYWAAQKDAAKKDPAPKVEASSTLRESQSSGVALLNETAACIEKARELKKPYAVLAATMRVRIEDSKAKQRKADFRTTYTLLPLRDISLSETIFKEQYQSGFAKNSVYFPGSEREISHGSGSRIFDVVFEAKAQQPRSVTTGTVFFYDLPLNKGRPAFGSSVVLNEGDDHFAYPNDGDVICEITLIVESEAIRIAPVGQAAKRITNRIATQSDATVHESKGGTPRTVSARWTNVMPTEQVGIHYTW